MKLSNLILVSIFISGSPLLANATANYEGDRDASLARSAEAAGTHPFQNTQFCQVDEQGKIISEDSIEVSSDQLIEGQKGVFDGLGGGCVERPIREVWAVMLNLSVIKAADINDFRIVATHPELEDPSQGIYFVFDIESVVRRLGGLVKVQWITRWFHSVTQGTYAAPEQVVINFKKISGSAHVAYDKESFTLDRVGPNITSFTMREMLKATQVNAARVKQNIVSTLSEARNGAPNWEALPDKPFISN
jgi:hypothetical protein